MKEQENQFYHISEEVAQNKYRLKRLFADDAKIMLPEKWEDGELTELSSYAFSGKRPEGIRKEELGAAPDHLREISGDYLLRLSLPDSLLRVGSYAFYNCSSLERITMGADLREFGSDAFMNCRNLKRITIRCGAEEASGARALLTQLTGNIELVFKKDGKVQAAVFFPEYTDAYDEVAAAHIFRKRISGEGFRARQCFKEDILDFAAYDSIFPQACVEETPFVLMKIAMDRLRYPYKMSSQPRKVYEKYVKEHQIFIVSQLIKKRGLNSLKALWELGLIDCDSLTPGIRQSIREDWAEGTATLIQWNQSCHLKQKKDRYSFTDF